MLSHMLESSQVEKNDDASDRYLRKHPIFLHEHDFNSVYIAEKRIFRCSTCGLVYCERCGKLVSSNKEAKYHSHEPTHL
jgi:hypothetical protein